ncbi:DUF3329 domain-containing protein [Butyrivibrio sp. MB2005]|uniref:DUF3329 domain-containing protein n=1 Tax=Butyrivibrio sp. MB2005 TaxID=1280678 RepID=UPI0003F81840|nr:DUF6056 family protein [Butyrivibrio sp. MB2005]
MAANSEMKKKEKMGVSAGLFNAATILCFISILIYEFLTPMMMDDMGYLSEVKKAGSFFDLFAQEKAQYLRWTGRSVAHLMARIIMYIDYHFLSGNRIFFNILAACAFTVLTRLIYSNIRRKTKYDVLGYVLIVLLLWIFGISFAQTILWETGACNYLLTTTIILGFMTCFRKNVEKLLEGGADDKAYLKAIGLFVFGIIAGWCNENTSGGCLLFILFFTYLYYKKEKKVKIWMIFAILGNIAGLAMMVLAPGNALRAAYREELHSGILGMAARFLNITLVVRDEMFVLLAVLIVLIVFLRVYGKSFEQIYDVLLFAALSLITTYSLVLTVTPQSRALFGAGIFLIIAVVQAFNYTYDGPDWTEVIRRSVIYIACLYMFFTYLSSGASLARIYREEQERYAYLEEYAKTGEKDVVVPKLRPQFETKYSSAYDCDITEDWQYWVNVMMAEYYGFNTLVGVDRDEWTEY